MKKLALFSIAIVAILGILVAKLPVQRAEATVQNPCESFCADWNWNHTRCEDTDYRLCHHNPSHNQTLTFNNLQSCNNHVGTPHNNSTYDSYGACSQPTATPTNTPTVTPTKEPTPTLEPTPTVDPCEEEKCEPTPTVEPTPTAEPTPAPCTENCGNPPTFAGSSTEAPQCTQKAPEAAVNPHVYRNGDVAIVKWWNTEGNKANIYYKQVSSPDWQYSVTVPNTGYAEIKGLGTLDISFAVQQVNDCSGGVSVIGKVIVDGVSDNWVLFR